MLERGPNPAPVYPAQPRTEPAEALSSSPSLLIYTSWVGAFLPADFREDPRWWVRLRERTGSVLLLGDSWMSPLVWGWREKRFPQRFNGVLLSKEQRKSLAAEGPGSGKPHTHHRQGSASLQVPLQSRTLHQVLAACWALQCTYRGCVWP